MVKIHLFFCLIFLLACGKPSKDDSGAIIIADEGEDDVLHPHCCHFIETVQSCSAWMGCFKVDHFSCQNLDTGEDCRAKRTHLRHATSDRIFSKPSGTCKGFEEGDFNNPC
jgi:hypothetical protein